MQERKMASAGPLSTWVLVFEPGEEAQAGLLDFASRRRIGAAYFTALGAFERARVAFFDLARRDYDPIPVNEQVEVLSLVGNVARHAGEPRVHTHAVLGRRDGTTLGGHLLEGWVRPTLEVMLTETPEALAREIDPDTGLPLLKID